MQNKLANIYLGQDSLLMTIDPNSAPEGIYITLSGTATGPKGAL